MRSGISVGTNRASCVPVPRLAVASFIIHDVGWQPGLVRPRIPEIGLPAQMDALSDLALTRGAIVRVADIRLEGGLDRNIVGAKGCSDRYRSGPSR